MGIGLRRRKIENIDEHGMPTEPVAPPANPLHPIPPAHPSERSSPPGSGALGMPSPPRNNRPVQRIQKPIFPTPLTSLFAPKQQQAPGTSAAPVPVNAAPLQSDIPSLPPSLPERLVNSLWRNVVPPAIRLCCRLIQILLLLRFIGKLIHLTSAITWVNVDYVFSDILLIPFRAILPPLNQGIFTSLEPYTLLAIVVYGLCARLLIGLTKVFVDAHV